MLHALANKRDRLAVLIDGLPGVGKSHLLDQFALDLAKSKYATSASPSQTPSSSLPTSEAKKSSSEQQAAEAASVRGWQYSML